MMLGSNYRGFTLIELMVVMVIIGTMLALVGPFAVSSVEKTQHKTELMQLENWLNKVEHAAFYRGQAALIEFNGHQVSARYGKVTNTELAADDALVFESLFFQPQQAKVNRNGYIQTMVLSWQLDDRGGELNLGEYTP